VTEITLKSLTADNVDDLVTVHQLAYKTRPNLTYYLGRRFVASSFTFFYNKDDRYGVVAYDGVRPLGFCVGASFVPFRLLNSYRKADAIISLFVRPWLWLHRAVGLRLARDALSGDSEKEPDIDGPRYCFIYSIAVVPDASGKGIGKKLLEGFENLGKQRGLNRCIIPIGADNVASIKMARGRGYKKKPSITYQGNLFFELFY
jgi:GNAT superfamily N-acetyltransferase